MNLTIQKYKIYLNKMHANKILEAKQNETNFLITKRIKNQAISLENISVKTLQVLNIFNIYKEVKNIDCSEMNCIPSKRYVGTLNHY